ncbi:MAG: hypothetical protein HOC20_13945 [Chloroflexi bacterium]|nr:hypothetical protein [Chloroflexota bacterium]
MAKQFLEVVRRFFPEDLVEVREMHWFTNKIAARYYRVDMQLELDKWECWIEKEHGKSMRQKFNRLPKNYKSSLLNWFQKAGKFEEDSHVGRHDPINAY